MSIPERIDKELADAMRARDAVRLSALRLLKSALTNKSVERGRALTDGEAVQVVQALAKQRHDSIEQFARGGREDLVAKERAELQVLETYMPPALSDEALSEAVEAAITEAGATSMKDMGKVMKLAMARLAGHAVDGRQINELVKARLAR
jgi:uncharacterized protein YqeY